MEQRLIDANIMKEHVAFQQDILVNMGTEEIGNILVKMIFDEINIQPTVDAVPVVRCEKCRHGITARGISDGWVLCTKPYTVGAMMHPNDWFCADGERRTE